LTTGLFPEEDKDAETLFFQNLKGDPSEHKGNIWKVKNLSQKVHGKVVEGWDLA